MLLWSRPVCSYGLVPYDATVTSRMILRSRLVRCHERMLLRTRDAWRYGGHGEHGGETAS
eukprot:3940662-Rhodomonas_salina.3